MATHSSVPAWRIPGMGEPGGLPSMGSHRVGHDWRGLAAAAGKPTSSLFTFLHASRLTSKWDVRELRTLTAALGIEIGASSTAFHSCHPHPFLSWAGLGAELGLLGKWKAQIQTRTNDCKPKRNKNFGIHSRGGCYCEMHGTKQEKTRSPWEGRNYKKALSRDLATIIHTSSFLFQSCFNSHNRSCSHLFGVKAREDPCFIGRMEAHCRPILVLIVQNATVSDYGDEWVSSWSEDLEYLSFYI